MATNVPDRTPVSRKRIEAGLDELRKWWRKAIHASATAVDDDRRESLKRLADDLEFVIYRLGVLLHPAGELYPPELRNDD